jgi:hypothetical protein
MRRAGRAASSARPAGRAIHAGLRTKRGTRAC